MSYENIHSSGSLINLEITILGDPYWLGLSSDDVIYSTDNYSNIMNNFAFRIIPTLEQTDKGVYTKPSEELEFSNIYILYESTSILENGKFSQKIKGIVNPCFINRASDRYNSCKEQKNLDIFFDTGRIYMAEVKDTRNRNRAGEIKVWVLGSNIPREDSSRWVTASYASSFFGTSTYEVNDIKEFEYSPISFGAWFPIPFIGNKVFIFYPAMTGSNVNPYWFAFTVNPRMNSMAPGIPSQFFGDSNDPLTEMNVKMPDNESTMRGVPMCKREEGRGVYTPLKNALESQGLETDNIRGYSTAGSQREAPSMCYGFLTPLGNSFTMDDGWSEDDSKQSWKMGYDNRELRGKDGYLMTQRVDSHRNNASFRFRTRNRTQLWIGDEENIYAINADGSAWYEISEDGKLHGYAASSVDIACDGDINFKSKKKISMEADEGFVFQTVGDVSFESADNINVLAPVIKTRSELQIPDIKANNATIDNLYSKSASLKGVFSGTLDGTAYAATLVQQIPAPQPIPYTSQANVQEPIIEPKISVKSKLGETVETIVTEMPSHETYSGHTNRAETYVAPVLDTSVRPYSDDYKYYRNGFLTNQVEAVFPVPPDYESDPNIPAENLSEHFTLAMLYYSDTTKARKISNVQSSPEINNLKYLANNILEQIWRNFCQDENGNPNYKKVIVNSGYRGKTLNVAVNGATSSQHCFGEAADIEIPGYNNYELAKWIRDNIPFDQLILEYADNIRHGPNSGWVHVSYRYGSLRKDVLTYNKKGKVED